MPALFAAVLLSLMCGPASAQPSTPRSEQLERLLAQKKEADAKFAKDFDGAGDDLAKNIARYNGWPGWQFGSALVDFAEAKPEDQSALDASRQALELCYAVGVTDLRIVATEDRAWSLIEKYHLASSEIGELCILAGRYPSPRRIQFLETVVADGQAGRRARALATYGLAECRFAQYERAELAGQPVEHRPPFYTWIRENRTDPSVEADLKFENCSRFAALASDLYRQIQAEYADVGAGEGRGSTRGIATLGDRAGQRLYALEHLSIGAQAPEINGLDIDGQPLKLSDFRGKVIVVSFWFTGCGPCMAMLPQEKQLVDDLRGKPFQMLSVCNDVKRETAKATVSEKGITWPNWFDGPTLDGVSTWLGKVTGVIDAPAGNEASGSIAKKWNVDGWPTIYVLDEKGTIRGKHLHGEGLNVFVHKLVSAVERQ